MLQTSNRTLKSLAVLTLILISGFIILSVLVHITNSDINPVRFPLSRYGIAPNGYLLSIGLFMIGLAEIITGILIYNVDSIYRKWLMFLLLFIGVTAFITAILPMDIEPVRTIPGTIHNYTAGIQFVLFPVAALLYGFRHRSFSARLFSISIGFTVVIILPFITFTVFTENPVIFPFYGLLQKVYILMILLWLGVIATFKLRNAV